MSVKALLFARAGDGRGGVVNFIELYKQKLSAGVEVKHFQIGLRNDRIGGLLRIGFPVYDMLRLIRLLRSEKFDVYHLNPSFNMKSLCRDGLLLFILMKMGAGNIIVFFHGWEREIESRLFSGELSKTLFLATFGRATKLLVLAREIKTKLAGIGICEEKILVMSTMFDGRFFEGSKRTRKGPVENLVFLSRLARDKGAIELLQAFVQLSEQYSHLKLVIAGDGPVRPRLEMMVKEHGLDQRVKFIGFVTGDEKVGVLKDGDLFVFPTYHGEGCPVSLLEAMAVGLPVVSSRVGGIPDVISEPENGILLDEVNQKTIADGVRPFLESPEYANRVGENNFKKAWKQYEATWVTRKIENIYREIIEQNPA